VIITRDPDDGWVNVGCYRVMVYDCNTLGMNISPGKHGRMHRAKYFEKGKPCPVVACFGVDPLLHMIATRPEPYGKCEFDAVGGIKGEPVEVIEGEITGLPIPAYAEIAVDAEILPDLGDCALLLLCEGEGKGVAVALDQLAVVGEGRRGRLLLQSAAALLEAERSLVEAGAAPEVAWAREDNNGDGHAEVSVRTGALTVTLDPEAGGMLTELGYFPAGLDVADVLARRFEAYHDHVRARAAEAESAAAARTIHEAPSAKEAGLDALLAYDGLRRGSLIEGFFDDGGDPLDPVAPWARARAVVGAERLDCAVRDAAGGVVVVLSRAPTPKAPVTLEKCLTIRDATLDVRYRLRSTSDRRLAGRWGVQWNLALTAGSAPDRYLDLATRPSLGSSGREAARSGVALVDEWAGVRLQLEWSPAAELAWGPVETVSVSEGGFERIYQGTALLLVWRLDVEPGDECLLGATLTLARR